MARHRWRIQVWNAVSNSYKKTQIKQFSCQNHLGKQLSYLAGLHRIDNKSANIYTARKAKKCNAYCVFFLINLRRCFLSPSSCSVCKLFWSCSLLSWWTLNAVKTNSTMFTVKMIQSGKLKNKNFDIGVSRWIKVIKIYAEQHCVFIIVNYL